MDVRSSYIVRTEHLLNGFEVGEHLDEGAQQHWPAAPTYVLSAAGIPFLRSLGQSEMLAKADKFAADAPGKVSSQP